MSFSSPNTPVIPGIAPQASLRMADEDRVGVTVIIPVYNEEESLNPLVGELLPVLEGLGETFEILFVDDGSVDKSLTILRGLVERDSRIRVVRLAGNFGQQWANTAGLRYARGRAVVMMDADLQQPPQYIPALLDKLREGHELVFGRRITTTGPLYRRMGSRFAGAMIRRFTGLAISDTSSNYLALHGDLVARVNMYNDHTRHLASIIAQLSFGRCAEVNVEKRDRQFGTSKYDLALLVRTTLNLIFSLSLAPLNVAHYIGGAAVAIALMLFAWAGFEGITAGMAAAQFPCLAGAITFLGGVQLITLGVFGEYLGRVYLEVRQRPPFIVEEVWERPHPGS